ncbi:condensation domain-containing protein, partial [Paenibacillus polymyxa]|uniref:condensation domain-containing protein n=1 Tax=Paenibacillus polymyxa TaxID=1406 RepID=UPI002AB39133
MEFTQQELFWNSVFSKSDQITKIPYYTIRKQQSIDNKSVQIISSKFSNTLSDRIMKITKQTDIALFLVLLTGVDILLYQYTNNETIILGASSMNHDMPGKVILLKSTLDEKTHFKSLFNQNKLLLNEVINNQNIPFRKLTHTLDIEYTTDNSPIINTLISLREIHSSSILKIKNHIANDLHFDFSLENDSIKIDLHFNNDLYDEITLLKLLENLEHILSVVLSNPEFKVHNLENITENQCFELLNSNNTATDYPKDTPVYRLFEEQVKRTPTHPAVMFGAQQWTYQELNERANQLAHTLQAQGVQP